MTAPRLLDQVHERIRTRHLSYRTERAYFDWIRRFIRFHGMRHPREMAALSAEASLGPVCERARAHAHAGAA